jgi:hypothetical protein
MPMPPYDSREFYSENGVEAVALSRCHFLVVSLDCLDEIG